MISDTYRIDHFVESLKHKNFFEVIHLADQEALEVWRLEQKHKTDPDHTISLSRAYRNKIIALIHYLRYDLNTGNLTPEECSMFKALKNTITYR